MFCSQNFENALYHIPDYIEKVKIDEILRGKRRDRQHEIENLYSEQDPNEAYNYPFADDLDKNYTENAEAMQLQEYIAVSYTHLDVYKRQVLYCLHYNCITQFFDSNLLHRLIPPAL